MKKLLLALLSRSVAAAALSGWIVLGPGRWILPAAVPWPLAD